MATNQYYGTIPNIAQAFQNDPRSKLAQSALALGTSIAPVAQGSWAIPDGLARAAQAIVGAVVNKNQEKKFSKREADYTAAMQQAAQLASNPAVANPATQNPMTAAAAALGGTMPSPNPSQSNGPLQQIDPNAAYGAPSAPTSPVGASPGLPVGSPPTGLPMPSGGLPSPAPGAMPNPTIGGTGPSRGAAQPVAFINPLGGKGRTTDNFGGARNHNGIDWAAPAGTPVAAAASGTVIAAGSNNRSGNYVRVRHPDGSITGYAHLSNIGVKPGQQVEAGMPIGAVGSTGRSTGNHLHFTVTSSGGKKVNPASIRYGEANAPANPSTEWGGGAVSAQAIVPPAEMEAVPNAPAAPPSQAPTAPQLPPEVATQRLAIAQSLLQSGNPDLVGMASQYLNEGLNEQNAARMLAAQQAFQQGQTGYNANLNDWQGARSDVRQDAYGSRRDALQRNFTRGERRAQQQYQSSENQVDRNFRSSESRADRAFQADQTQRGQVFSAQDREDQQTFMAEQNALNRGNKLDVVQARQQQRSAYFNTPTGLKMQQANQEQLNKNQEAISKYRRFMDLNEKQGTGGAAQNLPIIGGSVNWMDRELSEMDKIAKDTTLANLGGGLGAQISDSDRKFIEGANLGTANSPTVNTNVARARIGALQRQNDYLTEFANAQADNTASQFAREWSMFANSVPIVQYGKDGKPVATDSPMTFSEWKASRPRFDASGKRVK